MNNARRKQIAEAIIALEIIKTAIEGFRDEEEDAYDNLPESIQDSARGEEMQEAVDALEDACDSLDEALDRLNDAI